MQHLTGMYDTKLDSKGRLSLPARLRTALATDQVVVVPGLDENHLMLMTPEYFETDFYNPIASAPMALMDKRTRIMMRRIIAPSIYVDIDGNGRIGIPQNLREKYSLAVSSDVLVIGTGPVIEVWNPDVFNSFTEEDESAAEIAQSLYEGR